MAKKCSHLFLLLIVLCNLFTNSFSQSKISPKDLNALREIKNQLTDIDIPSTHFLSTWNFASPDPCSSFNGVTCSSTGKVVLLSLGTGLTNSPGLAGTLSPSIAKLTELNQLILFAGIVTGSIPPQIGSLKNLRVISLTNNRLNGAIPATIFNLPNLHTLDLSHNQLSGSIPIPPTISGLTQLKVLVLASNRLSGLLPSSFPDHLLHLDLSSNGISGMLPRRLPSGLRYLSVAHNHMWGPLNGLELLSDLVYLDLSMNQLSGSIPTSLFRPTLNSMLLQRNNLSGGVPQASPTIYGSGSIVDLSHNFLTGELTTALTGVETLFLNNNLLTGSVPKEYVNTGSIKTLYLQHNYFSGFPDGTLSHSISICLSYNCMVPPMGLAACPKSAGDQLSRPSYQCSAFRNRSTSFG